MKSYVAFALLGVASSVTANELDDRHGYSYFTLGVENVNYEEAGAARSSVNLLNPVINTGGLYRINEDFDFSIDALATFSPVNSEEEWRWNGQVIQHNEAEYLKTATNILVHYKLENNWRFVVGPSLSYQTFTRYGLKNYTAQGNKFFHGTWEETTTSIFANLGMVYDDGTLFAEDKWHISGKALIGLPLYSQTSSTQFSDTDFDSHSLRTSVEGTISYEIFEGLHLGWFAMLGFEKRLESDSHTVSATYCKTMTDGICQEQATQHVKATLPESETLTWSTGLKALWSF
ncbi:hypothetical protein ATG66_3936 [Vibrio sp. ES.051]|uniref:hypothetical protein n=1 Tax=Vibrio sp. ES.051 TaxID=1761909 RepID=UPI000BF4C27D|nr:hypothetical protein [Vibrio sp. ES.051]PFG45639.1 hypothetical protein ATG66_3936 [Vibrio sp. ES.051]